MREPSEALSSGLTSWLIDASRAAAEGRLPDQGSAPTVGDFDINDVLQGIGRRIGAFTVARIAHEPLIISVQDSHQRFWELRAEVDRSGRFLTGLSFIRSLPPFIEIREMHLDDGPALSALCRRTPIVVGESQLIIDEGDDYGAPFRLMAEPTVLVGTHTGKPVAVHAGVVIPVRIDGTDRRMALILHSRVAPEHAATGLFNHLNDRMTELNPRGKVWDCGAAYIWPGNDATSRLSGADAAWSLRPYRCQVPCPTAAPKAVARVADPHDVTHMVSVLNTFHCREELFAPFTKKSFAARVERAPDVYGWANILVNEHAVIGVRSQLQKRVTIVNGATTSRTIALVLDYGHLPGHERDLLDLMDAAGAVAARRGATHLGVFTSDGSPSADNIRSAAEAIEAYDFVSPFAPEPPGLPEKGLYVDQVYF